MQHVFGWSTQFAVISLSLLEVLASFPSYTRQVFVCCSVGYCFVVVGRVEEMFLEGMPPERLGVKSDLCAMDTQSWVPTYLPELRAIAGSVGS